MRDRIELHAFSRDLSVSTGELFDPGLSSRRLTVFIAVVFCTVVVAAGVGPLSAGAAVGLTPSTTATAVHDAAHSVVTAVAAGSTVHDSVTVGGGGPAPTGTVAIDWFTNGTCSGLAAATSAPIALVASAVDATGFAEGPLAAGSYGFLAHYAGDSTYAPSDGSCEPLQVVDANVQISAGGTNPVGGTRTFTAHVNVNPGTGLVNAPDGTQIGFSIDGGPGSFTSASACTTAGGTGNCQVTLTSPTPGTTIVSAHVTTWVGGVPLTRSTDGSGGSSGPATELWTDAAVQTEVHDESENPVTSVDPGTPVHDKVFVTKLMGTPASVPNPTGSVIFHRYATSDCTGTPVDESVALAADGTAESSAFTAQSDLSYGADYSGDANYPSRSSACEPLTVRAARPPPTPQPVTPHIQITRSPTNQTVSYGASLIWSITVTNDGDEPLSNVRVTDQGAPDCAKTSASIAALASILPGANVAYTCTLAGVTASLTNVATATGTPPLDGADVSATDTAHVLVTPPAPLPAPPTTSPGHPAIRITTNPTEQTIPVGGNATFEIVVTNTGDVTLTNVRVTDRLASGCKRTKAQIPALALMAPRASLTYRCSRANVTASFTNVATSRGAPPSGPNVLATDSARVNTVPLSPPHHVPPQRHAAIEIVMRPKKQSVEWNADVTNAGTAKFTITVTNTGSLTLHAVTVTDPWAPDCSRSLGVIGRGAHTTYACTRPGVTTLHTNHAAVVATSPTGRRVRDHDVAFISQIGVVKGVSVGVEIHIGPAKQRVAKGATATFRINISYSDISFLGRTTLTDALAPDCNRKGAEP